MSFAKSAAALGLFLFSSVAMARTPSGHDNNPRTGSHSYVAPRVTASVHLPAFSFTIGAPPYAGAMWVGDYHDHLGIYHAGYWRPGYRAGWIWMDGFTDRFGRWHPGFWARR